MRHRRISPALPSGVAVALLLSLFALVGPAPATAASTYLCKGYAGCAQAGYSDGGYSRVSDRMYWRMYAGHNCTNYVAYRMIKAGMSTERPWSGSGMAYNWGVANASITNQTPTVGSVAWWKRNSGGVGSSGHVAYVERVISSREIIISEDSWGGDFSWRRIVKDSGSWPSGGFIHFKDAPGQAPTQPPTQPPTTTPVKPLTSTAPPTIGGTAQVGAPLTGTPGGWSGAPTWFGYQWLANGVAIPGATGTTYVPPAQALGKTISLQITAKRGGYQPGTATSAATAPVAKGAFKVVTPTTVVGTPLAAQVLTATPGSFSPAPEKTALQWRADGQVIPGATGRTLPLDPGLVGKKVTALTIARGEGFVKTGSHSPPAGPVLAGAVTVTTPYAVLGLRRLGETLTVRPGAHTPADATPSYTWLRDGAPISGATAPAYRLTTADVGHDVALQVRLTKPSYLEKVGVVAGGLVRTTPTVETDPKGRSGKAVIKVRVSAPGVAPPPGEVAVMIAGRKLTAPVRDGRARLVVPGLAPGRHAVVVRFLGTQVVEPGSDTASAWVKR